MNSLKWIDSTTKNDTVHPKKKLKSIVACSASFGAILSVNLTTLMAFDAEEHDEDDTDIPALESPFLANLRQYFPIPCFTSLTMPCDSCPCELFPVQSDEVDESASECNLFLLVCEQTLLCIFSLLREVFHNCLSQIKHRA